MTPRLDGGDRGGEKLFVALLRAVNVGGRNTVPMRELRAALETRFADVTTVLQSGNVLLTTRGTEHDVSKSVAGTVEDAFGLAVPVVVRTADEFGDIASHNPFLKDGVKRDPKTLHVAFLSTRPTAAALRTVDPARSPPDAYAMSGREVYLEYPNGSARTRLTLDYLERCLGATGTARNWRTVERLAKLCAT